eukprot:TRINITY_DN2409_c0_g3_i2.p1 TRINITY_DN2409_c0_g3~~TRINITY_DN2409_c0_g3_i2.p1  ORF type:complete len:359 (+),score=44.76 TRINITY_DN2409_c0_g3_i2:3-1079(+)
MNPSNFSRLPARTAGSVAGPGSLPFAAFGNSQRRFGSPRQETLCCKSQRQMESQTISIRLPGAYAPDVIIGNPAELERKKKAIKAAGLSTLQVIADFDMTLTKYKIDGKRGQSCHALLCQGNVEYDIKRQQLYDHYYPSEICPTIPVDQKTKLMEEWWEKSHGLLVEGGLNYRNIKESVANATIGFRDGLTELFEILDAQGVPCLIFSAGLADIIEEVMRQKLHRFFGNIRVVSNRMDFDEADNLIGFRGRTIHVLNKNEHALEMAAPLHDDKGRAVGPEHENGATVVEGRTNVLLLGDHLGDLGMSDGVNYDNRISVGFLNENVENWLHIYKDAFDVVVVNDGSMNCVVELMEELSS